MSLHCPLYAYIGVPAAAAATAACFVILLAGRHQQGCKEAWSACQTGQRALPLWSLSAILSSGTLFTTIQVQALLEVAAELLAAARRTAGRLCLQLMPARTWRHPSRTDGNQQQSSNSTKQAVTGAQWFAELQADVLFRTPWGNVLCLVNGKATVHIAVRLLQQLNSSSMPCSAISCKRWRTNYLQVAKLLLTRL